MADAGPCSPRRGLARAPSGGARGAPPRAVAPRPARSGVTPRAPPRRGSLAVHGQEEERRNALAEGRAPLRKRGARRLDVLLSGHEDEDIARRIAQVDGERLRAADGRGRRIARGRPSDADQGGRPTTARRARRRGGAGEDRQLRRAPRGARASTPMGACLTCGGRGCRGRLRRRRASREPRAGGAACGRRRRRSPRRVT